MSATRAAYDALSVTQPWGWTDIKDHIPRLHDFVINNSTTRVLELGVRSGVSTAAFLAALEQTGGQLWSVDIESPPQLDGPWHFVRGNSTDPTVQDAVGPDPFGLIFVDTDHTYELTKAEIAAWKHRLKPGGRMVFHDTSVEHFPHHTTPQPPFPVAQAVFEWLHADEHAVLEDRFLDCNGLMVVRVP